MFLRQLERQSNPAAPITGNRRKLGAGKRVMSFLRESEQQLLAVNDIRPTARRLIQQLR